MSMGGGSGGSGNQTNTFTPPLWTLNQWPDLVQAATTLDSQPQQHFFGQRIAPINNTQAQGMQYLSDLSGNVSPDMAAARRNLQLTASGSYENPYATQQTLVPGNDWIGARTQVGNNAYQGMSPAYDQFKQSAMDDVVRNYQNAIAPQTDAAFNHAGAFHAGGHDAAIAANQYALAKNLGNMSASMDNTQWQRSGDLAQQNIGLNVGAQQGDLMRSGNLAQQGIQLGAEAQNNDYNRASQAWNQERDRQMGSFNPILQANQFDQNNARNMIGIGDIQRGYSQDLLNSQLQDWQSGVNYPQTMLDNYASILGRASGNYGQNAQTYNQPNYSANPFAAAVGAGLLGAGAYSAYNTP